MRKLAGTALGVAVGLLADFILAVPVITASATSADHNQGVPGVLISGAVFIGMIGAICLPIAGGLLARGLARGRRKDSLLGVVVLGFVPWGCTLVLTTLAVVADTRQF